MLMNESKLYLPVSRETIEALLAAPAHAKGKLRVLTTHELSALLVIQHLPRIHAKVKSDAAERLLADSITAGNEAGLAAFVERVGRLLDPVALTKGLALLDGLGIRLLAEEEVEHKGFLHVEGGWDYTFRFRHSAEQTGNVYEIPTPSGSSTFLTQQQFRIVRAVDADIDDHLHVQGYAGTGKSYMLKAILDLWQSRGVQPQNILVLAYTPLQLAGLRQCLPDGVQAKTFGNLAADIIPPDLTQPVLRRLKQPTRSRQLLPPAQFAARYGFKAVGPLSAEEVVRVCHRTVRSFCESADAAVGRQHLPPTSWRSEREQDLLVHYATQLWHATVNPPSSDGDLPVNAYHRIKFVALQGWEIPNSYSHVIVDESHDLTRAMLQILDRSPQAIVSLGDEYQSIKGRPAQRSGLIRQRYVTRSVRAGRHMENIVNPIIMAHPGTTKELFEGSSELPTHITYYTQATIPEAPAAILVGDDWALFEWAQRLAAKKLDFTLLGNYWELNKFVQDCIELYNNGAPPRHGALGYLDSWDAAARRFERSRSFAEITRLLSTRYGTREWERDSLHIATDRPAAYTLGKVNDARNHEFDRVMLTPDVLDLGWEYGGESFARTGSALYIGTTRVRHHLLVPQSLREWIEEIGGR